jgi:hypothetical protein
MSTNLELYERTNIPNFLSLSFDIDERRDRRRTRVRTKGSCHRAQRGKRKNVDDHARVSFFVTWHTHIPLYPEERPLTDYVLARWTLQYGCWGGPWMMNIMTRDALRFIRRFSISHITRKPVGNARVQSGTHYSRSDVSWCVSLDVFRWVGMPVLRNFVLTTAWSRT